MLTVHEIPGEPLRFMVQSRTNQKKQYLVELSHSAKLVICSCPHYQIRLQGKAKDEYGQVALCHHADAALKAFAFRILGQIHEHEQNRKP